MRVALEELGCSNRNERAGENPRARGWVPKSMTQSGDRCRRRSSERWGRRCAVVDDVLEIAALHRREKVVILAICESSTGAVRVTRRPSLLRGRGGGGGGDPGQGARSGTGRY